MKIGVNIGHYGTVGAEGFLSEVKCNTEIYHRLVPMLRQAGHEVIPCNVATPPDYVSATNYANTQSLDLLISLHNNSHTDATANGTEVMYYTGNAKTKDLAEKLSKSISARLGTKNRGAVPRNNIHIISKSDAPCVLIEGFFVSNKEDCAKYDPYKIALGIAEVFGYKEDVRYSYDETVNNMILDGITTPENMQYWEKALDGREPLNKEYVRAVLDRYHQKLRGAN